MNKYVDGMTVGQLVELLLEHDQNAVVGFAYNYGDYRKTNVVSTVDEVEEQPVAWSAYHDMWKVADQEDEEISSDDDDDSIPEDEGPQLMVIIR